MKFLYSDTQDYVDPNYDFIGDRSAPNRERYWDDVYAHEIMNAAPYDGLLVAMSAVRQAKGVAKSKVRYSTSEEQLLLRIGARKFLRFDGPDFRDLMLLGDCGAFAYADKPEPAFSPEEVVEFYLDAGFTHGISPDHVIFECNLANPSVPDQEDGTDRFQITLENARKFIGLVRRDGSPFEPLGAVQGWSPESMAEASSALVSMGYRYLAVGGLVPLKVDAIKQVLETIRRKIGPEPKLHLLGFAKADHIHQFTGYGITSFDSTSPLIRAFKDEKANYYLENQEGGLDYFTAIRIPQALENTRLMQGIKRGLFRSEDLVKMEQNALTRLRNFDKGIGSLESTSDAVVEYHHYLLQGQGESPKSIEKALSLVRARIERTLRSEPWKRCKCSICRSVGVEVIIFRSSNRNKRRGFHNLGVYHQHLRNTLERSA